MLSSIPPLQDGEVDVSYDMDSLFTNIPVEETINYIIEQICVHKMLVPICSKLIFRRLLIKLAAECDFKQVKIVLWEYHCLIFSEIYMVKSPNFQDALNEI